LGAETSHAELDSYTVLYGVFGDPVRHSKSPLMLNRAFQVAGINAAYGAFHILPGTLGDAVRGIRALGFRGVNVTIPHKVEVMDYLDEIDPAARSIGAVNTIVNENGKLCGYNTDGIGYVRSLREETGFEPKGANVLLIGAGGAARGIAYTLASQGVKSIRIANRSAERAQELAGYVKDMTDVQVIGLNQVGEYARHADVMINLTPVGMSPNVDAMPVDPEVLHSGLLVSDTVYTPLETKLLREAKLRGARTHRGLGMFIYQGAYAFEYWTGQPAPVVAMREVVERSFNEV
jgi:shikimate dehydrogenase